MRPALAPQPTTYLSQLDGLRAILAVYVVWHHTYLQVWPIGLPEAPGPIRQHGLVWLLYGRYAVCSFIVLSGFCLTLPVIRKGGLAGGAGRFLANRFWRIVPSYWASILICCALIGTLIGQRTCTHWDMATGVTWGTFLACVGFLPEVFSYGAVNHVLWSVAIETKIYLLFPGLVAAWKRFGLLATSLVTSGVVFGIVWMIRDSVWYPLTLWFIPLFLMGMVAATIATSEDSRWRRWRHLPWGWLCGLIALSLVALGYLKGLDAIQAKTPVYDQLVGLAAATGLASLIANPGWVARRLAAPWLVRLGVMTYSLYLIHAPLLQLVHQYAVMPLGLDRGRQFALLLPLGTLVSLIGAWAFHRAIEKPSHQFARSTRPSALDQRV